MIIELPYPPQINNYYIPHGKQRYVSKEGKEFRRAVGWICKAARIDDGRTERLKVAIQLWTPDKRKRDIDNVLKPLLDALGAAGVYKDDSQIDSLSILRCGVEKGGRCIVAVEAMRSI